MFGYIFFPWCVFFPLYLLRRYRGRVPRFCGFAKIDSNKRNVKVIVYHPCPYTNSEILRKLHRYTHSAEMVPTNDPAVTEFHCFLTKHYDAVYRFESNLCDRSMFKSDECTFEKYIPFVPSEIS
jgi:hypothetical protein